MLKNYIEEKGFKIVVKGNSLEFYQEGKLAAETIGFINEGSTVKVNEETRGIRFSKTNFKDHNGVAIKEESYKELLSIREEIMTAIDNYFNNLDNVKLEELSNGSIIISEKTEEYKQLKDFNRNYFIDTEEKWLKENKKYFLKGKISRENIHGNIEYKTIYTFNKENISEEIEVKEVKVNKRYEELRRLAETMSDEDFEDTTGMKKEFILDI